MRFPWQHRADTEERHRLDAERRLDAVRSDWAPVGRQVAAIRRERELNGWTNTIRTIFGSPPEQRVKR